MATPAIQTLLSDAQQVLNLNSLSEVRATMAAALANANVGTPLNPNLTTQQLWDEFYLIVRQPESDIESIITNQLMKFLYAPPAPGGAGADGQVIFNDGGFLAGDPQFLWNKTTNLLTVTGSATITGDLTVRTNKLAVTSTGVGCGVASPLVPLHAETAGTGTTAFANFVATFRSQAAGRDATLQFSDGTNQALISMLSGALSFGTAGSNTRYNIDGTGISTWSVAGSTAMTLNSTGLAIGDTAFAGTRLTLRESASTPNALAMTNRNATQTWRIGVDVSAVDDKILGFYDSTSTTFRMQLTDTGNLGIGVAPSAWNANSKALQLGSIGTIENSNNADFNLGCNYNRTSGGLVFSFGTTKYATAYSQNTANGTHAWLTSTTAGNAGASASFTQAMTLDSGGRLLVGTTGVLSADEKMAVNTTSLNTWAVTFGSVNRGWLNRQSDAAGGIAAYFEISTSNTNVGSIVTSPSGTSYLSVSDYRLKEAVQPLAGGLARVSALKPSIYKWKVNGSAGEGFLAHELAEVVPFAVTGEKDAVNEDGTVNPQGVDLSKVVPILVAAIQELTARVQTLESR